jgi:hypothetical protein
MLMPVASSLRCRSSAIYFRGSHAQILLRAWMFVSCVYMLCCPVQAENSSRGVLPYI